MRSNTLVSRTCRLVGICACLLLSSLPRTSFPQGDVVTGKLHYQVCAGCHGLRAEGNELVGAPKLSGQEDWYLRRQMEYYRSGVRGSAPDDAHGARMAVMSGSLPDERALEDVVTYIRTLPDFVPETTLTGDANRGLALYAVCTACHGARGEGNVPCRRHD